MLGSMRSMLDKYQKPLLVALSAFLIAVFTIPFTGIMRTRQEYVLGTIYGRRVTHDEVLSLGTRWNALGLSPRVGGSDVRRTTTDVGLYLLLLAAREHGVQVGSDAVAKMVAETPPLDQRVEYVLADPDTLAAGIKPTDAEAEAYYKSPAWKDKTKPFDKVKEDVRKEVVKTRAKAEAARAIREARAFAAAAPAEGDALRDAFSNAADAAHLEYHQTRPFTERDAPDALRTLVTDEMAAGQGMAPALPDELTRVLFRIEAGKISPILHSRDKLFFFRVVAINAGFSADGKLFNEDWGWRNGRFTRLETYADYSSLVRAKARLAPDEVSRTYEEYLTVQKFLNEVCGPSDDALPLTADAAAQLTDFRSERAKALVLGIPVAPFTREVVAKPLDRNQVQAFYNEHMRQSRDPRNPKFGYARPDRVDIEYVLADLAQLKAVIAVPDAEISDYYNKHKDSEFLSDDRRTPKPIEAVRADIIKTLKETHAASKADQMLRTIIVKVDKAEQPPGKPQEAVPLEPLAKAEGLTYGRPRPFADFEMRAAVPDLTASAEFAQEVFSDKYRPQSEPRRSVSAPVRPNPISRLYTAGDKVFFFRVVELHPSAVVDFAILSAEERGQVESDYAHVLAGNRAEQAARAIKTGIARKFLALVAAENKFTVKSGSVAAASVTVATPVPPVLASLFVPRPGGGQADELDRAGKFRAPGEIVRLIQEGGSCYTAVTTGVDRATDAVQIEYAAFRPDEFTAVVQPTADEIDDRAYRICDDEWNKKRKEEGKDKEPPKPDEERPKPTDKQIEQAKKELLDEWKKKSLRTRYLEYETAKLAEAFREYADANPVSIEADERLRADSSPDFFHEDDEYALRRDKALRAAAFKLEPGKLSGPVLGDSNAAILLLDAQENRKEARFEMLSVRPSGYDPLSVIVTDEDAARYYEKNKEQFRRPEHARAEFLFASFDAAAARAEPAITEAQVERHYNENRATAYTNRMLDDGLRKTIRGILARRLAEGDDLKKAMDKAYAAAKPAGRTFENVAAALAQDVRLASGATPLLEPRDQIVNPIGYAPKLVEAIFAAKKDELVAPVRVETGWVIARVTERVESVLPELKDALPAVRAKARAAALAARARQVLEKIRADLGADKSLTITTVLGRPEIAAALPPRTEAETVGFVTSDGALNLPEMTSGLRNAAFSTPAGQCTGIVETEDNLQIARIIDAKTNRVIRVHNIIIPAGLFAPMVQVTDEEIAKQYEANKSKYERGRRYEVETLIVPAWRLKNGLTPTENDELRAAYAQLQNEYLDTEATRNAGSPVYRPFESVRDKVAAAVRQNAAQKKADEIAAQTLDALAKDKARPFKDLAAQFKDLDHSASSEYEPGAASGNPYDLKSVAGLDAFLASAKPGSTSVLLRSGTNPLLVRVTKVTEAQTPPLADVRQKVKDDAVKAKAMVQAKELADKVAAKIAAPTPDAMSKAAGEFTVRTRQLIPLMVNTQNVMRTEYRSLSPIEERLLELRPVSISAPLPPPTEDEKTQVINLAVVTQAGAMPNPLLDLYAKYNAKNAARIAAVQRYGNLLNWIQQQYRPTPR